VGLRAEPVVPLALDLPADPAELAGVRERLTEWLVALDVTAEGVTAVPLVASELVSNAIEHAYAREAAGRVRVRAELDERGGLVLTVADDGRWREHPTGTARRGGLRPGRGPRPQHVPGRAGRRRRHHRDGGVRRAPAGPVGADPPALAPALEPLGITESAGEPPWSRCAACSTPAPSTPCTPPSCAPAPAAPGPSCWTWPASRS
jgi:anti-sigma regulatory factor (Ser/Thr protein kinase)